MHRSKEFDLADLADPNEDREASTHPLGPLVGWVTPLRPTRARWKASLVLAGCATISFIAAWISPDRCGLGSHRQLGLPPCNAVTVTGYPCPTCGMTTAFAYSVRGRLISAFYVHPAGLALALMTGMTAFASLGVIATGRVWVFNWYRISPAYVTLMMIAVILIGWIFKLMMGIATGTLPVHSG